MAFASNCGTSSEDDTVVRILRPAFALVLIGVGVGVLVAQDDRNFAKSPFLRIDPDRVVVADAKGFKPCGECHTPEWDVWKETKHATGFETMHKQDAAQDIMTNMDLRVTKRDEALCMRCHYTVGAERKAVAGVSCESCHGAARDWINVHNKWGGGARDKSQESPAAREERIAVSRKSGMLRPSTDLYAVAANCFECHTVPIEELVNKGQHKAGTPGFELVKRVNSIRHNFLNAAKSGGENRVDTPERTRVMFVVGRMLAYEYSLRGLAMATSASSYSRSMDNRVKNASRQLEELTATVPVSSVTEILRAGSAVRLVPNNRMEIEKAADRIRAIGQQFVASTTGTALGAIDPLIIGERRVASAEPNANVSANLSASSDSQRPATTQVGTAASSAASSATAASATTPRSTAASTSASASSAAPAGPSTTAPMRPDLPGQIRTRPSWHSTNAKSGMADDGECAGCHAEAETALADSPHQKAARRLFGENAKTRKIADLYGIGAANAGKSNQICVSCHATIDEATKTVHEEGVSCERCHGAGASYLDAHKKGGNPQRGMRALKQAGERVAICAECHRISDERLLAAGHPSGADYDIVAASQKIKHWPGAKPEKGRQKRGESYAGPTDAALRAAFVALATARPIPKVTVVALPSPAIRNATAVATPAIVSSATGASALQVAPQASDSKTELEARVAAPARRSRSVQSSMSPSTRSTVLPRVNASVVLLQLEPIPATDKLTTEELMLLVKQRLARIYSAVVPR